MSSPQRGFAPADEGEQPGQHPLEHDPGGQLVVGGADDEPAEHGFGLVGGLGAEAGQCQQAVEIVERRVGDVPRAGTFDDAAAGSAGGPIRAGAGR